MILANKCCGIMPARPSAATHFSSNAPPPPNKVADRIFDEIDTDGSGELNIDELLQYLLDKFPSSVAHKMLRILDTDQDKKVSRDEWRRGWADGLLSEFVEKEEKKAEEKKKKTTKKGASKKDVAGGSK